MSSAATLDDVADLLGATFDAATATRVERLLEQAEAIIAGEVPGLAFAALDYSTTPLEVNATCSPILVLPHKPITTLTSVLVGTSLLEPWQYATTNRGELIRRDGLEWGPPDAVITIFGTFGPTGQDVAFVAADLVRQTLSNPGGLRMEVLGARTAQFDTDVRPMQLTSAHRRILNRYRLALTTMRLR